LLQGFKTTNESCYIPRRKLSLDICSDPDYKWYFPISQESIIMPWINTTNIKR